MPLTPDATQELRNALTRMVRSRVPAQDAEDIVQSALIEAIGSPHAPEEPEALRRWLFGVAKNKIVDFHRKQRRESFDLPDVEASGPTHEEKDLLRWAEGALPDGRETEQTLEWMLREGDGEKLESIAASEKLPAPRVRQRVSRLRRHLRAHWQKEVAVLAALGVIVTMLALYLRSKKDEPITHEITPVPSMPALPRDPMELAKRTRERALEKCQRTDWLGCVKDLDEAKALDPAGDTAPAVEKARGDARRALEPAPTRAPDDRATPSATPILAPESTAPARPAPTSSDFPSKTELPSKKNAYPSKMSPSIDLSPTNSDGTTDRVDPPAQKPGPPPVQQMETKEAPPTPPPVQTAIPQQANPPADNVQQKTGPTKPGGKKGK